MKIQLDVYYFILTKFCYVELGKTYQRFLFNNNESKSLFLFNNWFTSFLLLTYYK